MKRYPLIKASYSSAASSGFSPPFWHQHEFLSKYRASRRARVSSLRGRPGLCGLDPEGCRRFQRTPLRNNTCMQCRHRPSRFRRRHAQG
eukprot:2748785-Rhodomonas_salina.2